jgi:hypothetical protein
MLRYNDTAKDSAEPYPHDTYGMSDYRWLHEMASLIAADLPRLDEDDRQAAYETLSELRMWVFGRAGYVLPEYAAEGRRAA